MNKTVRKNIQRDRVIVSGIDDQWDADLVSRLHEADLIGNTYLLVVIDIFGHYAYIQPLKNKQQGKLYNPLILMISEGQKPKE